jgi:hypothetical protein
MKSTILRAFVLFLAALTSACGGGGSGGSNSAISNAVASTQEFLVRGAWSDLLALKGSKPFSIQVNSAGSVGTGTGTASFSGIATSSFFGDAAIASSMTITGSYMLNGRTNNFSSIKTTYVQPDTLPLGVIDDSESIVHDLVSRNIPLKAKVGDTGTMFILHNYSRYTKPTNFIPDPLSNYSNKLGTTTVTYVLEPDTANTAILKFISYERNTAGAQVGLSTTTLRITPSGAATYLSESYISGQDSVTISF